MHCYLVLVSRMTAFVTAGMLTAFLWLWSAQFMTSLVTSDALRQAAIAASREAALPEATAETMREAARRTLRCCQILSGSERITIEVNGRPAGRWRRFGTGDRIVVTLSLRPVGGRFDPLLRCGILPGGSVLRCRAMVSMP